MKSLWFWGNIASPQSAKFWALYSLKKILNRKSINETGKTITNGYLQKHLGQTVMVDSTSLLQKREKLKQKLTTGKYRTLLVNIYDKVGQFIQNLSRKRNTLSIWYCGLVIALVTLLIDIFTSMFFDEYYNFKSRQILGEILVVTLTFACVIAHKKVFCDLFFVNLRDNVIDAIESETDLADLEQWLTTYCNVKIPFFLGIAFSLFLSIYVPISFAIINQLFVGFGQIILAVIVGFQGGMLIFYLFHHLVFPMRLKQYQLKLYAPDPSNSEVIEHLSSLLNIFIYTLAALTTILTFIFIFFRRFHWGDIILLVIVGWGPIITFFIVNQIALAKIITKAKRKMLNEVQGQVELLQAKDDILDEKTITHIRALVDYHDHIKATRNSALDIVTVLNFINSLLIPLFTFLLSNFLCQYK